MSVHYKFKNTINYDAVKFDGVYISAADLKNKIIQQKKLGQSELQLENEETGLAYTDDQQIPKNTNIIVSRLPFANSKRTRQAASQPYTSRFGPNPNSSGSTNNNPNNHSNNINNNNHHHHHNHHNNHHHHNRHNHQSNDNVTSNSGLTQASIAGGMASSSTGPSVTNTSDLGGGREALELVSSKTMSEEEKFKHIQSQSTREFEPSRYARGGGGNRRGGGAPRSTYGQVPHPGYVCKKCSIPGHFISDCKASNKPQLRRSTGIPLAFLVKVDPKEKGARMTPSGEYAMSRIDLEAYRNPKKEKAPFFEDGTPSDEKQQQLQGCQ